MQSTRILVAEVAPTFHKHTQFTKVFDAEEVDLVRQKDVREDHQIKRNLQAVMKLKMANLVMSHIFYQRFPVVRVILLLHLVKDAWKDVKAPGGLV